MKTTGTVYIVQSPMRRNLESGELEAVFDLTPARAYGDLVVLLPAGPVLLSTEHAIVSLRDKLRDFGDDDHLLCLGDPAAIAVAAATVAHINGGAFKLLVWDRKVKQYLSIRVDLHRRLQRA